MPLKIRPNAIEQEEGDFILPGIIVPDGGTVGIGTASPARPFHIESGPDLFVRLGTTGTSTTAQIEYYRGGVGTYMGPTSGNEFHLYSFENIPFMIGLNNAEEFRITPGAGPVLPDNRYLQLGQFITGSAAWPSEPAAGDWIMFGQDLPAGDGLIPYVRHDGTGPWGYPQPIISRTPGDFRVTDSHHLFGVEELIAGQINATAITTGAPAINQIHAVPMIFNQRFLVTSLGFYVTTGGSAGSKARVGIYDNNGDANAYPRRLIYDGGEKATTTTGYKSTSSISIELEPGMLYWFAYFPGTAAPTIRCLPPGGVFPIGGSNYAGAVNRVGYIQSLTYAALPASFSPNTSLDTGSPIPAIYMTIN